MANPRNLAKICAFLAIVAAISFFAMLYDALADKFSTWKLGWAPSPCGSEGTASKGYNAFAMHVFFMALAFGLMAPIGAVTYVVVRDTLGLSQMVAKCVHGTCQLGAFLCSILGYTQMYYSHGADCKSTPHFQSVHSYVGIVVLVIFWAQLPSALVVFSNKTLLPPGGFGRKAFVKYHVFFGSYGVFAGLFTVILGILALEAKSTTSLPTPDSWYKFSRAASAALVTSVLLALSLYEAKAPSSTKMNKSPEDPLLLPVNNQYE
mmetsp:Transcript_43582/g.114554  ORF Transcript_43582/g.114554 Transcript_43582/m.114554 type:complete len:263 (+) Transcript_43582:71-859(+)|eukprot:CAMPEP_0115866286 /NCGR_PEP_ID=MMETSP0287-20121206/20170_1 /TAXON_ID=412157 /ORGANISM="Chrysochromulina rotalis, Strain UIO044" /LENGTH=262 /DNA_ID=CAMNT_0003320847 /DNA_START=71 /DNA_END=859 /DNA_ORIENTATION=-